MKRYFSLLLVLLSVVLCLVTPVYAVIETDDYNWILGKYNSSTKTFSPSNTSTFNWEGMTVRTIGPWGIYNGADGSKQGSVISFVDKNKPEDNGYPMVAEDDWDRWIEYFNGEKTYVKRVLQKWPLKIGDGLSWKSFANFSQLVELCGGKGVSYNIGNATSTYARSYYPVATLTASSYALKPGQAFKLYVTAKSYTYYYQYIDVKLTGAGNTYINQRFNSTNVNVEKNLYFSAPGQYRFTLQINDGVYRYATKEILINVDENPTVPEQPPSEPPTDPPDEPIEIPNQDPVAKFNWPTECYETDTVDVTENSFDRDGEIVDWRWRFTDSTGVTHNLAQGGGQVTFQNPGTYELSLSVKDDDGATDSTTKTILVKPPIPAAKISYSGYLKENRKVILDSSRSSSPSSFPIDHSKDQWTIEPVSGGTSSDIKFGQINGSSKEVLFKKTGTYKVGLKVANSRYESEWAYKEIVIVPDDPPVAGFIVPTIVFREPLDQSFAIIKLTDKSYSTDDDLISQRIWKYKFDSNNNGDFSDDLWVVLDSGNNAAPYLRVNHVGKYLFELEVKESFGQPTIPEFITDADYRRKDTASKALTDKVTDIKNVAPSTSFTASLKPKADLYFVVGDISASKTTNLSSNIDSQILANFRAKNIDVKSSIITSAAKGPNIVSDPSLETVAVDFNTATSVWGYNSFTLRPYVPLGGGYDSTIKRTGAYSVKLDTDGGDSRARGIAQKLTGWHAGKTVTYSVWVNLTRLNGGYIYMDLYGYNASGSPGYFDSGGTSINYVTGGWVQMTATETIPSDITTLYLRIFAAGTVPPDLTAYIDDVEVHEMDLTPLDTLFQSLTWRDGATRNLISLSDNSTLNITNTTNFVSSLKTPTTTNFYVLGTDTNKTLANSLIASNSGNGAFYYNTAMTTSLSSISANMLSKMPSNSASVSYILLSDSVNYQPFYSDYEEDPKFAESWSYVHDPNFVDNNNGTSAYNGKTSATPVSIFDKYGKYDVYYKAQDDPTLSDLRFSNYRLWSDPAPTAIIVHRKPIASFTVQPGTLYITDASYDPDFQYKRPDKGVVERFWQWKKTTDTNWTIGKPTGITQPGDYYFYLKVKDNYGVWSDPYQMAISVTNLNRPPNADFNWSPSLLFEADDVNLKNLSTDPDGDPLTYAWTLFDPVGITKQYSTKDAFISNASPGTFWVTLRVWDNRGGTDVLTKSFYVNELNVLGFVGHTEEWNTKRINYNRSVTGTDNSPRGYNVFWAGERFILGADTTDTAASLTKAAAVKVSLPALGINTELQGDANKTRWAGEMWDEGMVHLADGPYKFMFTALYSNGAQKTCEVWVNIAGSIYDYYRFHRAE